MSDPLVPEVLERYVDGSLDPATSVSVELFLQRSEEGRMQVNALADQSRIADNWTGVLAELEAPAPGWAERGLTAVGVRDHVARMLVATPSLRRSWFIAIGVALFFGLAAMDADAAGARDSMLVFLTLAPIVPVVGVSLAYGPGVDPAYEVTVASPISGFRLVLLRTLAVLGVSVAAAGLISLLAPEVSWLAAAWLVPAFSLSAICLALMTFIAPRASAGWVCGTWMVLVVMIGNRSSDLLEAFTVGPQVAVAGLGVAAAVVVWMRRERFDVAFVGLS
jgi:hypothetical protein